MGRLFYGGETAGIEIPDRVLAHVKVVATTKLRRGESFMMTWRHPAEVPGGRSSIWVQSAIPLRFVFDGPDGGALDPELLREMIDGAGSGGGLFVEIDPV